MVIAPCSPRVQGYQGHHPVFRGIITCPGVSHGCQAASTCQRVNVYTHLVAHLVLSRSEANAGAERGLWASGEERATSDTVVRLSALFLARFKEPSPLASFKLPTLFTQDIHWIDDEARKPAIATLLREATHPSRARLGRAPVIFDYSKKHCVLSPVRSGSLARRLTADLALIPRARGEYRTMLHPQRCISCRLFLAYRA